MSELGFYRRHGRGRRLGLPLSLCCLLAVPALSGCGPTYSPNTYSAAAVQQANKVDQGVVVGVRPVDISAQANVGTLAGGGVGGIAGGAAGDNFGIGSALGALTGSVIGGIVGSATEHQASDTKGFEYIVRKSNGELISVTQKDEKPLEIGVKVLIIAGNQARIVPDYTVTIEPERPAVREDAPRANEPARAEDTPAPSVPPVVIAPLPSEPVPASEAASPRVEAQSAPIVIAPPPAAEPASPQPPSDSQDMPPMLP